MDPRDPGTPAAKRRLDGDACIEDDIDEMRGARGWGTRTYTPYITTVMYTKTPVSFA